MSADASASSDTDATPIASYRFDFGDGTTVGPQAGATATHTYTTSGTFTVTVTVTDTAGQANQATASVSVSSAADGTNLIKNSGFEADLSGWNTSGNTSVTLTRVAGGHSGAFAAKLTNTSPSTTSCTLKTRRTLSPPPQRQAAGTPARFGCGPTAPAPASSSASASTAMAAGPCLLHRPPR